MVAGYAATVRARLPQIAVGQIHPIQHANTMLTNVRPLTREVQGRCGRRVDPELVNRRRLLTARERLSRHHFADMMNDWTECTNRLAGDVARRAYGFRDPDDHQRRGRLHGIRQARRPTAGVNA